MVYNSQLDSNYMVEKVTVTECYQWILHAIVNYYDVYI